MEKPNCCIFLFGLIILLTSLQFAVGCSDRVNWPVGSCPDGDRWACWYHKSDRDYVCQNTKPTEYPYVPWGNYVEIGFTRTFLGFAMGDYSCFCCRTNDCQYPNDNVIYDNIPSLYRGSAGYVYRRQ